MTEQVTVAHALCLDGPLAGEIFEVPIGYPQLLFHGHHYHCIALVNGVAQYRFVSRA